MLFLIFTAVKIKNEVDLRHRRDRCVKVSACALRVANRVGDLGGLHGCWITAGRSLSVTIRGLCVPVRIVRQNYRQPRSGPAEDGSYRMSRSGNIFQPLRADSAKNQAKQRN